MHLAQEGRSEGGAMERMGENGGATNQLTSEALHATLKK